MWLLHWLKRCWPGKRFLNIGLILSEFLVHFLYNPRWWRTRRELLLLLLTLGLLLCGAFLRLVGLFSFCLLFALGFLSDGGLTKLGKLLFSQWLVLGNLWSWHHNLLRLAWRLLSSSGHQLLKTADILFEHILDTFELITTRCLHGHHLDISDVAGGPLHRMRPKIEWRVPFEVRVGLRGGHLCERVILSEVLLLL